MTAVWQQTASIADVRRPVVDKLAKEIADIMTKTDVGAQIEKQGCAVRVRNNEEFTQGLARENSRGKTIVDAAGINRSNGPTWRTPLECRRILLNLFSAGARCMVVE